MTAFAGIDFDTHAVHVVLLHEDSRRGEYYRYALEGHDAFERTRRVRDVMPSRGWWNDWGIVAVGIEEPAGRLTGRMFRVQGAILACLPPTLLVEKLMPSEWRKAAGLPGNAGKADVSAFSALLQGGTSAPWPQDAHDAYCLALAIEALVVPA